ncbi:MAG: lytic transglycosylase domain-containing protein [Candidatus Enterousia sp.]
MKKNIIFRLCGAVMLCTAPLRIVYARGEFDMERWDGIIENVRSRAAAQNISDETIKATLKSPSFIPSIVKSDKNQSEFKLTLDQYLDRTVSNKRIKNGRAMRAKYPTMLSRVENIYGVPAHVILAFWGMESNYGEFKAAHRLKDAFFTLMYDGRRETFFGNQLLSLMKTADVNGLDINDIYGSWAGAMGHFQFIPTTLASYGVDGNGDGRVDIIHSVGDAMYSAANYLNKLGWNPNQRIVRRVALPANFDLGLLDGSTKKTLSEWAEMGVTNPDGTPIPIADMTAGLVADVKAIESTIASSQMVVTESDTDVPPQPVITAYLTYPNFYRIKKWNNSNWYAIAISQLADELK